MAASERNAMNDGATRASTEYAAVSGRRWLPGNCSEVSRKATVLASMSPAMIAKASEPSLARAGAPISSRAASVALDGGKSIARQE